MKMLFFERFRAAIAAYAEGVHALGTGTPDAALAATETRLGGNLPRELAELYRSFGGIELFHGETVLFEPERMAEETEAARSEGLSRDVLLVGETAEGGRIGVLGTTGQVLEFEADTGIEWISGSTIERFLDVVMARGKLLYDREGEFQESVFLGDEIAPTLQLKLAERAVKLDPESPRWHYELGRAFAGKKGGDARAVRAFERALELDPHASWVHYDVGKLAWMHKDHRAAEEAFATAADADPEGEQAGFFSAWAARAAEVRGDTAAAERHRGRARQLDPGLLDRQLAATEHELDAGDKTAARELGELLRAIAPRDLRVLALLAKVK